MPKNESNYPDWLLSLLGEFPLLDSAEWEFIAELRSRIVREAKTKPDFVDEMHLKKKLSCMEDNFKQVVEYLKKSTQSRDYFLKTYPRWQIVRDTSVVHLMEIANSVNKNSKDCQQSRIFGSSMSVIGGVICLATGSGVKPVTRIVGSAMMGLGALFSAGTFALEFDELRKKVKQAEQVIQQDKEYSEKLWAWLNDASYFKEAMDNIRYIDVDTKLSEFSNIFQDIFKKGRKKTSFEKLIRILLEHYQVSPKLIEEISDVIGMLIATSMLYDRYRPLFNLACNGFKLSKELNVAYDVFRSAFKIKSAVNSGKCAELTNFQKFGIASGIALDAIGIFLSAKDLNSMSNEAKEIVKAADKLKEEAKVFKQLYYEMNSLVP